MDRRLVVKTLDDELLIGAKFAQQWLFTEDSNTILGLAAFRRERKIVEENFMTASDLTTEPSVALVTGGAVLGFDNRADMCCPPDTTVAEAE